MTNPTINELIEQVSQVAAITDPDNRAWKVRDCDFVAILAALMRLKAIEGSNRGAAEQQPGESYVESLQRRLRELDNRLLNMEAARNEAIITGSEIARQRDVAVAALDAARAIQRQPAHSQA